MSSRLEPRPRSSGEWSAPSIGHVPRPDMGRLRILVLYPHARCNCRCQMCDIWKTESHDEIDPEILAEALPALVERGLERVLLSGGEPLMHADPEALLGVLRRAGLGITLLTTGLLLEEYAALVAEQVDDLVVSLDGPEPVHDRIRRVPEAYARLARGIRAVRAAERALGARGGAAPMAIAGRCTVQRANCEHLVETVEAARAIGLDRISFLAVDVSSEAFDRPGGWSEGRQAAVLPGLEQLPRLEAQIEAMEARFATDFAQGFIVERPAKLRKRLLGFFKAALGLEEFPGLRCNAAWVSAVVEANGFVRPCFFHPAIGRWTERTSISEVLDGDRARNFRAGLDVSSNPICARCVCSLDLDEGDGGDGGGSEPDGHAEGVKRMPRGPLVVE